MYTKQCCTHAKSPVMEGFISQATADTVADSEALPVTAMVVLVILAPLQFFLLNAIHVQLNKSVQTKVRRRAALLIKCGTSNALYCIMHGTCMPRTLACGLR